MMQAIRSIIYYILRVAHMTVNNLMAIPAFTVWYILLSPVRRLNPKLYWKIESIMFKALLSFVVMWANTGGYKIIETGDDLRALYDKHCLVLVNHQSTADIPCVMSTLLPKSLVIGQVMWIMDSIFMYTNFGWVSLLHGDFFIQQGKEARIEQLQKLRDHLLQQYLTTDKRWIVLFPEGGFLYKRRGRSQSFAKKNNLPVLEHVTLPRLGAMNTILDTVGDLRHTNGNSQSQSAQKCLDWVIDVTLAYPNGEPLDMHGICIGWWPPSDMRVHYRAYPITDIPADSDGRTHWLYDRYVEKEDMLEQYYKQKTCFNDSDKQVRSLPRAKRGEAPFDKVAFLIAYVFYGVSAYIFWLYVYSPVWAVFTYCLSFIF